MWTTCCLCRNPYAKAYVDNCRGSDFSQLEHMPEFRVYSICAYCAHSCSLFILANMAEEEAAKLVEK